MRFSLYKSINAHRLLYVAIMLFSIVSLWIHVYIIPLYLAQYSIETFAQQTQYQPEDSTLTNILQPRPDIIESSNARRNPASCPTKLQSTRNGVLAFFMNEQPSKNNPMKFASMHDYTQHATTLNKLYGCPVLSAVDDEEKKEYLNNQLVKQTYGGTEYIRNKNPGAIRGVDPHGFYDGEYTIEHEVNRLRQEQPISDIPSDKNWGGVAYSEYQLNTGKYDKYNIFKHSSIRFPQFF